MLAILTNDVEFRLYIFVYILYPTETTCDGIPLNFGKHAYVSKFPIPLWLLYIYKITSDIRALFYNPLLHKISINLWHG